MTEQRSKSRGARSPEPNDHDEAPIRALYQALLECWNRRDAADFAALYAENGNVVGFDGSQMNGRAEIEAALRQVFAGHPTAAYISIIKEVRFLGSESAILRAVAGMMPPGQSDINPAVNAVQTLVVLKEEGRWRIALFQNTPAAFHGRPELSEKLTEELRQMLRTILPDRRTSKRAGDVPSE
ncbi:MAG: SgcJ/EcaC family oxidoreductase [Nitrospirae bacterium]|nr:SgcJ/EcaC family oxidoreductase [Candidatus Manganitrophaceae bacterium]